MTDPSPSTPAASTAPMPDRSPHPQPPPPSGCCRVWLYRPGAGGAGRLAPLGDYPEPSPKLAAVSAFDQTEGIGAAGATFVVMSSSGHLSAWTVRVGPSSPGLPGEVPERSAGGGGLPAGGRT